MSEASSPCKVKCVKRQMLGSSPWKLRGYNSPCSCYLDEIGVAALEQGLLG
jgi:hypothetical protein